MPINYGINNVTTSGNITCISGVFNSGIQLGSSSTTATILGLSSTGTIPAIIFDTVGNNHGNGQVIYDFKENGTSLVSIDGLGNLNITTNGNIVGDATNPSSDGGAFIGHGMRRRFTTDGIEFAWGENISSTTEPGLDLFPIGGTHISSGILFRLSKNSSKTDTAMLINGSGNVGIGTSTPSGQLHVEGTGIFSSRLGVGTTSPATMIHASGSATGAGSMFRLQNTASSNNTYFDIKIGTPGNYDDYIFFARNGIDFFGAASNSTLYFPNDTRIASNKQIIADPNGNAFINLYNGSAQTDIGYISGNALRFLNSYSEIARFDSTGKLGLGTTTPSGQLHVIGSGIFASGVNITNQTASTIAGFDASKNVTSLSTATYPSLTELSYVKGVTSALQTQLNGKSNTGHTHTTTDITNFNTAVSGLLGKTIAFFTPMDNMPPATNFATLDTRNSIIVLDFDGGSTNEEAVFTSVIPHSTVTTSGLLVRINWMATSATTGNCRWGVQFEKMTTDLDADSFDTATEAHSATNATAGIPTITELTCTSIDSLVAGDFYRMKVYRDASDTTNDTIATDTELISVEVRSIA